MEAENSVLKIHGSHKLLWRQALLLRFTHELPPNSRITRIYYFRFLKSLISDFSIQCTYISYAFVVQIAHVNPATSVNCFGDQPENSNLSNLLMVLLDAVEDTLKNLASSLTVENTIERKRLLIFYFHYFCVTFLRKKNTVCLSFMLHSC